MSETLCISVTFLDARFHGRGDGGRPEWPPSPLRLFQAIVAANGDRVGDSGETDAAIRWLERQPPPTIVTPHTEVGTPYRLSVPNNAMDLVGRAWSKGNNSCKGDANPATHRTMKTIRPTHLIDGDTLHYLWPISETSTPIAVLSKAVGRLVALGWGMDSVVASASVLATTESGTLGKECWEASSVNSNNLLRTPVPGTLDALMDRHTAFLTRINEVEFNPVSPNTTFDIVCYRRRGDLLQRPNALFELRTIDGARFAYPQRKLIHIAGMVRHLAIEAMKMSPPHGVPDDWVKVYVAGHQRKGNHDHHQFSYLPLQSIGHRHTDPSVRRVMIAAPIGDDAWLEHVAHRLAGRQLIPDDRTKDQIDTPPVLVRVRRDPVMFHYCEPANTWTSVTPVILPGHDDRKPAKTHKLIEKALEQSGIEQPCTFEWSAHSHFQQALSAHKYDRDKRPTGYIRPDHLLNQTAVHLTLRFAIGASVPGPLMIGAGRHCGLGLMARIG